MSTTSWCRRISIGLSAAIVFVCGRGTAADGPRSGPLLNPPQYVGGATATSATPVLASSGPWVVIIWTAADHDRTDVYAATSRDDGAHFGPPVHVNDVDGEAHVYGEDPPRVAMAARDGAATPTIVVTWPSDRLKKLGLRSARSVDGGRTFSPSVSVGDETVVGERGFQSVAVGRDGLVRAAWLDGRRDPAAPAHANAGDDWDPMHLMYASERQDGPWSTETRLASNVCGCCKTALAIGADGSVYVAFRNIYPGNLRDISLAVSRDGRTFSRAVRVSEDHWALNGCPDDGPTMAMDPAGMVHLVWPTFVDRPHPAIQFFHAATRDGVVFTKRQRIPTLGSSKPSHPQMTLDACGDLTLVWDEAQAATRRVVMRQLTPESSGNVQAGSPLLLSGNASGFYPVVTRTERGIVAAWNELRSQDAPGAIAVRRVDFPGSCSGSAR